MTDVVPMHVRDGPSHNAPPRPLFPEIGVVAFVPEKWGGPWLSRHQVLTRLSRYFYVLWAEPAGSWRELVLGGGTPANRAHSLEMFPEGFALYQSEGWLPQFGRPAWLASWTAAERGRRAAALLRQRGCKTIVFYLWRPHFDSVLDGSSYDLSCYHIVDEYSFSPSEQPLTNQEIQLIKRVDQVFIHSPALLERKGHFNPHTRLVPNGVNYRAFATPQSEPADLAKIPRPRLGYVGIIKTQLDFRLLLELVTRHVKWSFVFVGPRGKLGADATLVDQLSALQNMHFLGHKPIEVACAYPQHMDVCLLPYKANDYTKYIYPLKLHEYLAGGKPIVGTPIRSLLDFAHVIKLASTSEEWSRALTESLASEAMSSDQIQKRRSIARQVDWGTLVHTIAGSLCARLGPIYREQFAAIELEAL
ncbi:MAG: glycosyltransferase [Nitrospira sp.]|nr:glycosyltransferase [Nitrospira sp.]